MKRILIGIIFTLLATQSAFALSVSANGGAYIPTGKYGDIFDVGYGYGLLLEQNIILFTSLKLDYSRYHAQGKHP